VNHVDPCYSADKNLTFTCYIFSKKGCFTTFAPPLKKYFCLPLEKSAIPSSPWKKLFRRPWLVGYKETSRAQISMVLLTKVSHTLPDSMIVTTYPDRITSSFVIIFIKSKAYRKFTCFYHAKANSAKILRKRACRFYLSENIIPWPNLSFSVPWWIYEDGSSIGIYCQQRVQVICIALSCSTAKTTASHWRQS